MNDPENHKKELEHLSTLLDLADKLRDTAQSKTFMRKFGEALLITAGGSIVASLVVGLALMVGQIFVTAWQEMGNDLDAVRVEAQADRKAIRQTAEASSAAIQYLTEVIPTMDQSVSIQRLWQVVGPLSNEVSQLKGMLGGGVGSSGFGGGLSEAFGGVGSSLPEPVPVEEPQGSYSTEPEPAPKPVNYEDVSRALEELDMVQRSIED